MRAVFGLLLIMLGLAMAVVWMPEHHGERQLAVVTDIATQGSSRAARADGVIASGNARTFSPQTPLLATLEAPGPRIAAHTAGVARVASPVSEVGRTTVASTAQATPAAAVVTGGIGTGSLAGANVITSSATAQPPRAGETGTVVRASAAAASMPRDELIRNLQRELKRVGCYHGEIDGDWGTGSRRAMGLFTDRVNATLPIDHPDFILLTLIRGHSSTACGKSCPSDQTMSDTGRCLPNAVVAQVTRRTGDRRRANRETEHDTPSASQNQPTTQSSPQSVAQAETLTTWTTSMRLAGRTSSLETETAAAAAASAATLSGPPLPGRMAMGGPQGGAFVTPPPAALPAQDAVRGMVGPGANGDISAFSPPTTSAPTRERSRRSARRGAPVGATSGGYVYRYYTSPRVAAYRAPRSFAAIAPARRPSRTWTGSFFGTP